MSLKNLFMYKEIESTFPFLCILYQAFVMKYFSLHSSCKIILQTLSQTRAFFPQAQQQSNYNNHFSLFSPENNLLNIICAVNTTLVQKSGAEHEYTPAYFKSAKIKRIIAWNSCTLQHFLQEEYTTVLGTVSIYIEEINTNI